ncbi:tetratricopeptide repeat protein [Candidatus Peregrinibacteria bacterium]|jgi:Tfp pilus assembly protein PilF|nr:tetratricopeptide repeat protein [Candidatus Peregrinibacteria bacterium]MBT3598717.1 tetratricopeptide repeat protein [Candidatus Peregrinibacteria bacterium]MBT4367552.1 tetratricopeptide repeat protein [Candidatus Peregrinibacteria bacterium]MBT4585372.1 tetratricopeptide repeat protein [Candidatus Peregrinibacteria bacterium]MBT6731273.1 tetratricopeptide repeat protein [Candidatus Peregrinibacteria bacterium]
MPHPQSSTRIIERLEKAEQLKMEGKFEAALKMLEDLLIEDPENVSALEEIADNELSLENYNRAEAAAAQAVEIDEKSYTGHYILGFLFSQKNQWQVAVDHFQNSNKLKSNNAEILRCLGWSLFNMGRRAQGVVTLERALNLDDTNVLTFCDLGVAYLQTNNPKKAKDLFQKALEISPDNQRVRECVQAIEQYEHATKN